MQPTQQDHFAPVASEYARSRPHYPPALFTWLARQCAERDLVWDCATGTGQAALALMEHFSRVVATDSSSAQLARATSGAGVDYRLAPAERSGLVGRSVDLITVAQALHWFDLARFYDEVYRVLKPAGVIAVWSYGVLRVEGETVDALVQHLYRDLLGPYWPVERRHVERGYQDLPFPFETLDPPAFALRAYWELPRLMGYCRSWSASARYAASTGTDPLVSIEARLRKCWGPPDRARMVEWPLTLLVGRGSSVFE